MENQNENSMNTQGGDLSNLKKMFSDYQNKQKQTKRKTLEEILAKYFVPRSTKELFRILPPKQGKKPIEEAFFHAVTTNTNGGKKKHGSIIYCPSHNDPKVVKFGNDGKPMLDVNNNPIMIQAPCPLCEKAKKMLQQQDPSVKNVKKENLTNSQKVIYDKNREIFMEANKWEAKKFYIVRGIDKGSEKDGVKFWRFKHNFKNQGTLDKLLPILEEFVTTQQADFSSEMSGTDLSIIMTDSEFNGHVYKTISAITYRGKSALHSDPIIRRQWLDDDITWREVFQPKKTPITTPFEYLQMVAMGTNPYWDDTDSTNKHWVYPGRPDLEEKANTRNQNLDSDDGDDYEHASDIVDDEYPRVTINNITPEKVPPYTDNAVDIGAEILKETVVQESSKSSDNNNYEDLPF